MATRLRVPLHNRGPALWPDHIPLAELQDIHRDLGTPLFRTMYQADKGGLGGTIISRDDFRYGIAPPESTCYMTVDPAISRKEAADETAMVVGNLWYPPDGDDERSVLFLRFVWHGRVGPSQTMDTMRKVYRYYRPVTIGVEAVAYQTALLELAEERYPDLPFEPVRPDKDKTSRFLHLGALYEFARIVHHPDLRASAFEHQLTRLSPLGNQRHDDMADAAEMLTRVSGMTGGPVLVQRPAGFVGSR